MVHDGDVLVKPAIGDPILRGKLARILGFRGGFHQGLYSNLPLNAPAGMHFRCECEQYLSLNCASPWIQLLTPFLQRAT
jgi:hypothetical protein